MSEPITRPLPYGDNYPGVNIETKEGGSTSTHVDASVDASSNKTMPWIALAMLIGGIALGLSIGQYKYVDTLAERARISESHWRNDEVELMNMKDRIKHIEDRENARAR